MNNNNYKNNNYKNNKQQLDINEKLSNQIESIDFKLEYLESKLSQLESRWITDYYSNYKQFRIHNTLLLIILLMQLSLSIFTILNRL